MQTHLESSEMFLTNKDVFGGLMYLAIQCSRTEKKKSDVGTEKQGRQHKKNV